MNSDSVSALGPVHPMKPTSLGVLQRKVGPVRVIA
jgi:hypothetical protein